MKFGRVGVIMVVLIAILAINKFLPSGRVGAPTSSVDFNPSSQDESESYAAYTENTAAPNNIDPLGQLGLEYYLEQTGESVDSDNLKAVVENFGCHQEIHIYKSDELVMRMAYFNGQVYEL